MRMLLVATVVGSIALGQAVAATAATVDKITPSKGKVGNTAVIHGSGLQAGAVKVTFGSTPAEDVQVPSDQVIKVKVPLKDPRDPDPVNVVVTLNGIQVGDTLTFEYRPAGPAPVISGFSPPGAPLLTPVVLSVEGTDFTLPQGRRPTQVFLISPDLCQEGLILTDSITSEAFSAEVPGIEITGIYEILVGFSDGAGANMEGFAVY